MPAETLTQILADWRDKRDALQVIAEACRAARESGQSEGFLQSMELLAKDAIAGCPSRTAQLNFSR